MIDVGINGIVFRVGSATLGETGGLSVLGKTLEEWVGSCIGAPYKTVDGSPVVNVCERLRAAVDRSKPITVALFCNAPLVTAKGIAAAVDKARTENSDVIALPYGYVFRTEYLFEIDTLYLRDTAQNAEKGDIVTDGESLSRVTDLLRKRILRYHAANGVIITDFQNTYIDCDVVIERGVTVEPYNFIKGKTLVKEGAHILPGNYIENCVIGSGAKIDSSRLYNSSVGSGTRVGPFAYIRPDTVIGSNCRIGDFVELKSCVIGDGSKVSHLTYIGDAELGKECNVGCGVVFANYDGKNKYRSVVGDRVFIGSNANIIAPVTVEDRAFIAAGSTITKTVQRQALAIARARQTQIPNWKGNVYAPPQQTAPTLDNYNLVQYSDGIIDGAASVAQNADDADDSQR